MGGRRKKKTKDPEELPPWEFPPVIVEVNGRRIQACGFELAFAEAVTAAYDRPGAEMRICEQGMPVVVISAGTDNGLYIRRE